MGTARTALLRPRPIAASASKILAATVMAAALAACSSTPAPNQALEQARSDYGTLEMQPTASRDAALELQAAKESLERANAAWQAGEETVVVDHLAYLAEQRVRIAAQAVALSEAERTLDNAEAMRTQVQLQARTAEAQSAQQQARALEDELTALQAEQTERGAVVTFGDVLFDVDEAALKPGGLRNVRQLADFLTEHTERQVLIEGFTDSTGAADYNRGLSERRAGAVRDALADMGVDPARLRTRGYGEQYPVASNDSAATRQLNRRVEVVISNDATPVEERR